MPLTGTAGTSYTGNDLQCRSATNTLYFHTGRVMSLPPAKRLKPDTSERTDALTILTAAGMCLYCAYVKCVILCTYINIVVCVCVRVCCTVLNLGVVNCCGVVRISWHSNSASLLSQLIVSACPCTHYNVMLKDGRWWMDVMLFTKILSSETLTKHLDSCHGWLLRRNRCATTQNG